MFSKGFLWNLWADNRVIRNMTCWIAIRSQMQSIGRMRKLPKTAGIYIRSILVIKSEINSSERSCIKWWTEHYGMQKKKKRKESLLPGGIANPKIRSYKHKDLQTGLFLLGTRYQSHRFIQAKQGKKLSATAPCASIRCCCFISTLSKAIASCLSASANLLCCTSWPQTCDSLFQLPGSWDNRHFSNYVLLALH